MRTAIATALATLLLAAAAHGGTVPQAMRDAVDQYAEGYATFQGWRYTDRTAVAGDYRRAHTTLSFLMNDPDDELLIEWDMAAKVVRCGRGWYVVGSDLEPRTCPPRWPAWLTWSQAARMPAAR